MAHGRLRVLLGAAPGVGKTFTMLEEGRRLKEEGSDVVIALVEDHGRHAIVSMTEGLETIPRLALEHRGVKLTDLDLAAVLARKPQFALVDELAHTNAPGLTHEKRWQDVQTLLEAGINIISTVNIQHIESLNDVVLQITGVPQRETIPDEVLRRADEIELVDITPQTLRERLSEGLVYPHSRIDAALSNYFRLGNLTALREIALLWLADEVDSALKKYRTEHGIDSTWETRERVVVALTGGPEGETLLRRGARIAARSAGRELIAVHVTAQDGLREPNPGALAAQRLLVERLGGSYHQVLGNDIPRALVDFAKAANATQLVIGVSRRSRLASLLSGPGIGTTVVRESGDIDVHIVTHSAAGGRFSLPRLTGALTLRRRILGWVLALAGGPLLTWLLAATRGPESITVEVLSYQLLVVLVALTGGFGPALFAALLSGLTLDFFFIEPLHRITINEPAHFAALVLYVVNALLVSYVVDQAARRSRAATRAAAETELLATVAGSVLRGEDALQALLTRTREAFGLAGVRLVSGTGTLATDGDTAAATNPTSMPVGGRATLELYGRDLEAADSRLLAAITSQIDAALEYRDLAETAREIGPLAEADRVRSALLQAVGHDLRRPLTAATAAITGLRSPGVTWSEKDREELLATAEESLASLSDLVTNLLDASRLQAGVLAVELAPVDVEDVVLPALEELGLGPGDLELDIPDNLEPVLADPVLLRRVIVNLLANALRHTPPDRPALIAASQFAGTCQIRIIDHGPGIPADRRAGMFLPFQRTDDTDNLTGLGLGLALSKGFTEGMGGTLELEDTPDGGLTMVISLPQAAGTMETPQARQMNE